MEVLPLICFIIFAVAWVVQVTAVILAAYWSQRSTGDRSSMQHGSGGRNPIKYTGEGDVTILKPVTGADPSLRSNLISFFHLKYDRKYKVYAHVILLHEGVIVQKTASVSLIRRYLHLQLGYILCQQCNRYGHTHY